MSMARQKQNQGCREVVRMWALLLLLVICAVAFPALAAESALRKATLMPLWSPRPSSPGGSSGDIIQNSPHMRVIIR